jgi:2-hydroxy-6-oxonona-2,4-dienedioate hydrolase
MALNSEGQIDVPGLSSRWIQLPGGVKAHYVTAGETGPAVVLLHGGLRGGGGLAGWRFMVPALGEAGFRVYAPDMPSFGLTEDPSFYYTPGKLGHRNFIHDFTQALCLDKFHLSGNSMGGSNAVNYMLAHPDRIVSFILVACDVGDIAPMDELATLYPNDPEIVGAGMSFDGTKESMHRMLSALTIDHSVISEDLVEMRTISANRNQEGLDRGWYGGGRVGRGMDMYPGLDANTAAAVTTKGRLDKITIPGLYMHGKLDYLQPPEWGYVREDRLPNIQFFYQDNCGHQGQTDLPDLHHRVYIEFFRDGQLSRATADEAGVSDRRPELPGLIAD